MISPPQDYTKSELARVIKQPRVEWNIESVANSEKWTAELPIIPILLNRSAQSAPSNTAMYLAVEAEDIRFPVTNFKIDVESAIETEFRLLSQQWKQDTLYSSSLEEICFHPAYQTIMAMGEKALPLILRELRTQFGHWFYALNHIARKDVAKDAKDTEEARRRWIEWGRNTGKL